MRYESYGSDTTARRVDYAVGRPSTDGATGPGSMTVEARQAPQPPSPNTRYAGHEKRSAAFELCAPWGSAAYRAGHAMVQYLIRDRAAGVGDFPPFFLTKQEPWALATLARSGGLQPSKAPAVSNPRAAVDVATVS
jgi:hypothetical protein